MSSDFKLCYVDKPWAYFTTQELKDQWGDDWDDAPYEHNAGAPYEFGENDKKKGIQEWRILKVAFDGSFDTPSDLAYGGNSNYSVQAINAGAVAWLFHQNSSCSMVITAGTPLHKFREYIETYGGEIYLPSI